MGLLGDDFLGMLGEQARAGGGLLGLVLPQSASEKRKREAEQLQMEFLRSQMEERQMQAIARQQAQRAAQEQAQQQQALQGRLDTAANQPAISPDMFAALRSSGPMGQMVPGMDAMSRMRTAAGGNVGVLDKLSEIGKRDADAAPKPKKLKAQEPRTTPDGRRVMVNVYDDGTYEVLPDVGPDKEKLHFFGDGARAGIGANPYTGQVESQGVPAQMDPAQKDTSNRAWQQLRYQQGRDAKTDAEKAAEAKAGPKPEKTTDPQLAARGFLHRMQGSAKIIDELEDSGYAPSFGTAITQGARTAPFVGGPVVGGLANKARNAVSPKAPLYEQAQNDWIRAKLRKESGAVIGVEEEEGERRTYFPQPGDDAPVIKQKREARRRAEMQIAMQGGTTPSVGASGGWSIKRVP